MTDLYYPRTVPPLTRTEAQALADALFELRFRQFRRWVAAGMSLDRAISKVAAAVMRHRAIAHGAELA